MKELLEALNLYQINGYTYVQEVGSGKASATLLYQKADSNEKVIIKMLISPRNDTELHNFRNEVEALRSHKSGFVPELMIDIKQHVPYPVYFYGMEFVNGITLSEQIDEKPPPWSWEESVEMLHRISFALSYSSALWVHRDLHPGNILLLDNVLLDQNRFVYEDPAIRILDFGCNKNILRDLFGEWYEDKFRHPGALSTWSPEFINNPQTVDRNHDSWALGVMLYRFLTGKYPIHAECFGDLIAGYKDEPKLINKIDRLELPLALKFLLKNLLSFDPSVRFLTGEIGDMCADLLYRDLNEQNEEFIKLYMEFGAHVHRCYRCFELVGRHHAKCPSCGNILDVESCLPVLKNK